VDRFHGRADGAHLQSGCAFRFRLGEPAAEALLNLQLDMELHFGLGLALEWVATE
jgi:hypothetical protein